MNSNDLSGRLALVAPSAAELLGQDISKFDGEYLPTGWAGLYDTANLLTFTAKVRNEASEWDVECEKMSNCKYAYSRDHTPVMMDITPPNICQGEEIYFHINPRKAHTTAITPSSEPPYRSLHMGSFLLDTEDIIEETDRLDEWVHNTQYAFMTDGTSTNSTEPGFYFTMVLLSSCVA